nr:MAG TPA_asm: hypothetical protein [Bacteriophage sp.]
MIWSTAVWVSMILRTSTSIKARMTIHMWVVTTCFASIKVCYRCVY